MSPLTSTDALRSLARELSAAPRIALDAEGDGYYRYRARLCTIQVAEPAAVIDPLADIDLSPLAPVFGPDGPTKVVHDAAFDARILAPRGLVLANVFDTSIAARFLGETATGLSSLLARYVGVALDKGPQLADWGARPLGDDELAYLVADVMHLLPLAALLEERLRAADLLEEVEEESRYMLDRALDPEPERPPWTRIKGARDLPPSSLALLAALADVREEEAKERDVPPFRVAPNGALFEAARRADRGSVRRVRGLSGLDDGAIDRAFELAKRGPPETVDPDAPSPAERSRVKGRERALTAWRSAEAKARGVHEQAVLPGHCLRDLAHLDPGEDPSHVEGLGEKRLARYGAALRALLG